MFNKFTLRTVVGTELRFCDGDTANTFRLLSIYSENSTSGTDERAVRTFLEILNLKRIRGVSGIAFLILHIVFEVRHEMVLFCQKNILIVTESGIANKIFE